MEILLTAILGALAKLADGAVSDAYEGLKALIRRKLGADGGLAGAIESVEQRPESDARRAVLAEEVEGLAADPDPEILAAAQAVVEAVSRLPDGPEVIREVQVTQTIHGDRNVVSGTGDIHIATGRRRG